MRLVLCFPTLDIVGTRWTLLIIRDLLPGTMRFQDLQERLPGMAPNVLSDRLKTLGEHIVRREFCQRRRSTQAAYTLTDPGRELASSFWLLASGASGTSAAG